MSESAGSGPEVVGAASPEPEVLIDLGQAPPEPTARPRRLTAGVATALAVAVVAAGIVGSVQFLNRGKTSAAIVARPTATAPEDEFAISGMPALVPTQATFTDEVHGYLIMLRCPTGKFEECTSDLSVTEDGGRTWWRRALPGAADATATGTGGLGVLAAGSLVLDQPEGFVFTGSEPMPIPSPGPDGEMSFDMTKLPGYRPARRWVSRDGGQTWQGVSREAKGTVSEVSAGSLLFFPEQNSFARMPTDPSADPTVVFEPMSPPAEVLRHDGTSARLKNGPTGGTFNSHAVVQALDGSIWVAGFPPSGLVVPTAPEEFEFPGMVIRVSRDRGRTWHEVKPPDGMAAGQFFTALGRTVCLLDYNGAEQANAARLAYSHDSGANWATLVLPDGGSQEETNGLLGKLLGEPSFGGIGYSVAPLPNGKFLVADGRGVRRLDPDAGSLVEVAGAPDIIGVMPAGRWVIGVGKDMATYYGSPDGAIWIELNIA